MVIAESGNVSFLFDRELYSHPQRTDREEENWKGDHGNGESQLRLPPDVRRAPLRGPVEGGYADRTICAITHLHEYFVILGAACDRHLRG
jgi:hypothetical protein